MSQFYVGQRVRVKWVGSDRAKHLVGAEGSITGEETKFGPDVWVTSFFDSIDGQYWQCKKSAAGNCFEPILLSGLEPAEESVEELLPFLKGVSA